MVRNLIFMSIRPRHVARILAGTKTVELRRVAPTTERGRGILIYSTSPVMAIVAVAEVDEIVVARPGKLWNAMGKQAGVTRADFDAYFVGADEAVAIRLGGVRPLKRQVPLSELRMRWPWLRPPQSFRYVRASFRAGGAVRSLAPGQGPDRKQVDQE